MPVSVLTVAQMREWEKRTWATGQSEANVIREVGAAVARRASVLAAPRARVLVLAGKGHNGDDARAALPGLNDRTVTHLDITDPTADLLRLEAALAETPDLVIDGLFGIGLNRPLSDAWVQFIQRLNQARCVVLAVDTPSGLDADTGETYGVAVIASVTLTVGAPKAGLLQTVAAPFVGRLELARHVGLSAAPPVTNQQWIQPEDFRGFPPLRPAFAHKGNFGHLTIVAGSQGYHGAAVLAARAAQRAQPGLITLLTHESGYHPAAAQLQAVMVNVWTANTKLTATDGAVLIGPGLAAPELGDDVKPMLRKLWRDTPLPLVVDASALDWLNMEPFARNAIRVLTPHPGEAARLLRCTPAQVQADRPRALRDISRRFGHCWVILKGQHTLIGRSEDEIFVNSSGNPHLAQGGSGDVLAGFLAGLLAQPDRQADVAQTLRYAVWQHGAAAEALSVARRNWTVEDLVGEIGNCAVSG